MQIAGIIEVICAPLLIIGSGFLRSLSSLVLTVITIAAIYTIRGLQYRLLSFMPLTIILGLLLLDRYILDGGNEVSDKKKTKRS